MGMKQCVFIEENVQICSMAALCCELQRYRMKTGTDLQLFDITSHLRMARLNVMQYM